jgi:hypothetical protein
MRRRVVAAEGEPDPEQADHEDIEVGGEDDCHQETHKYDHFREEHGFAAEPVGKPPEGDRSDENPEQARGADDAVLGGTDVELV